MQSLAMAITLQEQFLSISFQETEGKLARSSAKRLKNYGYGPVTIRFLGGEEITLMVR